jgi:hypothetical protein
VHDVQRPSHPPPAGAHVLPLLASVGTDGVVCVWRVLDKAQPGYREAVPAGHAGDGLVYVYFVSAALCASVSVKFLCCCIAVSPFFFRVFGITILLAFL